MNNQFEDTIDVLKSRIAELDAEAIDLKRTVNSLCRASGKDPLFSDSELGSKGFTGVASVKPAQFYGKPPTQAAREYLEMRNEAVELEEIMSALVKGGFDFDAQGWKNEVMRLKNLSISLGKNSGTFHRLPNGMMGLTKWYPNVKAKRPGTKDSTSGADGSGSDETEEGLTEDEMRDAAADAANA